MNIAIFQCTIFRTFHRRPRYKGSWWDKPTRSSAIAETLCRALY